MKPLFNKKFNQARQTKRQQQHLHNRQEREQHCTHYAIAPRYAEQLTAVVYEDNREEQKHKQR